MIVQDLSQAIAGKSQEVLQSLILSYKSLTMPNACFLKTCIQKSHTPNTHSCCYFKSSRRWDIFAASGRVFYVLNQFGHRSTTVINSSNRFSLLSHIPSDVTKSNNTRHCWGTSRGLKWGCFHFPSWSTRAHTEHLQPPKLEEFNPGEFS